MMRITDIEENMVYTEITTEASSDELQQSYERVIELGEEYDKIHVYEDVTLSGTDFLSMHTKATGDLEHRNSIDLGRVVAVGGGFWMNGSVEMIFFRHILT